MLSRMIIMFCVVGECLFWSKHNNLWGFFEFVLLLLFFFFQKGVHVISVVCLS